MDNLVLIRVARVCDRALSGAVVRDFREDPEHAFRLLLAVGERGRSIVLSLEPGTPWTGSPVARGRTARGEAGHFAATVAKALRGAVLKRVEKPPVERRVTFHFADGRALVAELVPHRSNLVLLDAAGSVVVAARRRRKGRDRVRAGQPYLEPSMPPGRADPFTAGAEAIRSRIQLEREKVLGGAEALSRALAGVGPVAAGLLAEESRRTGDDLATVLSRRLDGLLDGSLDPVVETRSDPLEAATRGQFAQAGCRLLPWTPPWSPEEGVRRLIRGDAAATAGLFYGALELALVGRRRSLSLLGILDRESRRLREVEARVAADLEAFEDPDRHRRWGEALLAGLNQARRVGDHVMVPDPYDLEGGQITVPVDPGRSLTQAAETCFSRHRRARRGLERARERECQVKERRARLEALQRRFAGTAGAEAADELERALQAEGIPVGLERRTGRGGTASPGSGKARIEGVRIFLSRDGEAVLIGKSGRDNHRLTFKLASPEDFWLHALGVPGAHVVVRNERRRSRPSTGTLNEAAEAAAWFSESREQLRADVQWTRRKYVRKLRGAPPGTVTVKRSETIRVRPRLPAALEGAS